MSPCVLVPPLFLVAAACVFYASAGAVVIVAIAYYKARTRPLKGR